MLDFLTPTKEQITEAQSGGFPEFENNENVTFLIEEIKDGKDKEGNQQGIIAAQIVGGKNDKKKYSFFLRNNQQGMKLYVNMMLTYFTEEQIINKTASAKDLIGKKVESIAKKKDFNGKTYTNFYEFQPVSDVPDELGGQEQVDAIGATAADNSDGSDQDLF